MRDIVIFVIVAGEAAGTYYMYRKFKMAEARGDRWRKLAMERQDNPSVEEALKSVGQIGEPRVKFGYPGDNYTVGSWQSEQPEATHEPEPWDTRTWGLDRYAEEDDGVEDGEV